MIVHIENWKEYRSDGETFLKTAQAAHRKKKKAFSPEAIYNITCMGIEKLIMAFLMKNGDLADNHTMKDLLGSLMRHLEIEPELAGKLLLLDSFQQICGLDEYQVIAPTAQDLQEIVTTGEHVHTTLYPHLWS